MGVTLYTYPLAPQPKVRPKRSDIWKPRACIEKWHAFKDRVRELGVTLEEGDSVVFVVGMPASWGAKKRAQHLGSPHRQKPDLDNLLGGLMDAVHPTSDSHLSRFASLGKVWGETDRIEIQRNVP